jgi:hypothetical protein
MKIHCPANKITLSSWSSQKERQFIADNTFTQVYNLLTQAWPARKIASLPEPSAMPPVLNCSATKSFMIVGYH